MKHFYLIANPGKAGAGQAAVEIAAYLESRGARVDGRDEHRPGAGHAGGYTDAGSVPDGAECVITLGGDGTLIQAARDLVELGLPMIGVNLGHLGYLTQVSHSQSVVPMLDALLEDRFTVQRRMMLEGEITGGGKSRRGIALNDIVLTRRDVLQVLNFQVLLNGIFFNEYMADGMIVATPTGSTAYNLSAGGPIVTPEARLMVLTPICAHSINSRSIVLSSEDLISIRPVDGEQKAQTAVFDGDQVLDLEPGDTLTIRPSKKHTRLIQLDNAPFLENLKKKMARI
ncbi:MAG: NAD(+)/NADH kinase [Eubacteriales bacterium]|nr:NAD(+)/NADH kinase [Eubacteriales bacterium]